MANQTKFRHLFSVRIIYSTEEIENQWKEQWFRDICFAHGSNDSRGVAILIRKSFDFKLKSFRSDEEGRYLILAAIIQDVPFLLVNINAPNTTTKQSLSCQTSLSALICDEGYDESDYKILLGGDLNVKGRTIFDAVRTISDVMEFTKMRDYQGIMTTIDFEKAFNSLNWNFLRKSLEFFGFGESFLGVDQNVL